MSTILIQNIGFIYKDINSIDEILVQRLALSGVDSSESKRQTSFYEMMIQSNLIGNCKQFIRERIEINAFYRIKMYIQAKLYYRTIRANMDRDEYFKDFKLANYRFIVCNGENLDPLVWEDTMTTSWGDLYFGKNKQILMRDPYNIAKELNYYLSTGPKRPMGIVEDKPNNLFDWINKIE